MQTQKLKGTIYILIATVIWGSTFVAQSATTVQPFTYQGVRSVIGAVFLVFLSLVLDAVAKKNGTYKKPTKQENKTLVVGGIVCGVILFGATNLQQFGIHFDTDPGKAGFITAMYILIVPIIGLFTRKKVPVNVWISIGAAVVGLFLLCVQPGTGFALKTGDYFLLLCALVFAFHIVAVDYFAPKVDGVKLSCLQFIVSGFISCVFMFIFEQPSLEMIRQNTFTILYAGIGSSGIAYTLQIVGQKYSPPTIASLVMSFESVFAVLSQVVVMWIMPSARELAGCAVMFLAIMLSQLPEKREKITE